MGNYRFSEQDEYPHAPTADHNFNESVYTNAFDARHRLGGWMRIGNRVNEGYAEMAVCLYLPDGRIACQFQRPTIAANNTFAAGALSYEVTEAFKHALFSDEPLRRYMVVPNAEEQGWTIRTKMAELVQLNGWGPHSYSRDELVKMLDETLNPPAAEEGSE